MPFSPRPTFEWRLSTRTLPLGRRTLLMGILNVTPDSFSDGGQFLAPTAAVAHALQLLDEGADILDIGGESTRPGATPLSSEEERARILPVITAILATHPSAILSIDTYHAATAAAAIAAGAEIINDVSGLMWDPAMPATIADLRPGLILMHTRGRPAVWPTLPALTPAEVMPMILRDLATSLHAASEAGIAADSVVLDPGIGFGKRLGENYPILARFNDLQQFNLPLLAGPSRKRFLRKTSADLATDLAHATTAANVAAILNGAHILRVHHIPPAREAAAIADAVLQAIQHEP